MATNPAAVRRWTFEEFSRLPDDGNRYEVIAGELYVTPAPRYEHQRLAFRLAHLIEGFLEEYGLGGEATTGPVDVVFAEGDYLEPDLIFVRGGRDIIVRGIVTAAPDLVVEVISDSTARRDRGIKRERYARFGVPEYWIADIETRQIEVYHLSVDPLRPQVVRDTLRWQPYPDGPVLEIDVQKVIQSVMPGPGPRAL
jgi:Uma2 family endonuclease